MADWLLYEHEDGRHAVAPADILPQLARAVEASDEGHDPLCMAILRGKACSCGLDERTAGVAPGVPAQPKTRIWMRKEDLERLLQDGEATAYVATGDRPFENWTELSAAWPFATPGVKGDGRG